MSQIDEIKARVDIVDLVAESVKLRRSGRNYIGLCPFHSEKTPSFVVSPERQTWRCFGQCNEGGDVFSFLMKKEGWDFKEALRFLAARTGIPLEAFTPQQQAQKEEYERLRAILEAAVVFYQHQLWQTPAGQQALEYLRDARGLKDATIEAFGLGYAPAGWETTSDYLLSQGYSEQDLIDAGLVVVRQEEQETSARARRSYYDRFRHRLMIPIRDETGKMCGFGARILDPQDVPKFLNSPETPVFSKSRLLYGLDRARKAIRTANQAVIVEGYFDVIALHQAGFENVVAPMGTALTEDQLRLLKRYTRRIVLALDPDAAGQAAILHGLEAARQSLDHTMELRFDARGLLRHEARLQADLRVVVMPDALDPDEIVQREPSQWATLIENAQPIVVHVMQALAAGKDLEDAKVKAEIAAQVLPLIEDIPDPVEREAYRQKLARFLRVDERALVGAVGRRGRGEARRPRPRREEDRPSQPTSGPVAASLSPAYRLEAHVLSVLLRRPDLLYRLDRLLQQVALSRLLEEDFGYTGHQVIFRTLRAALEQDEQDVDQYLQAHLSPPLDSILHDLLHQAEALDSLDERLLEDLLRAVCQIRRQHIRERLSQLRFLQEEAQEQGDLRTAAYLDMARQLRQALMALDKATWKAVLSR